MTATLTTELDAALAAWPIFGASQPGVYGIGTGADALVTHSADGVDVNEIWEDFQVAADIWNTERQQIADLISFRTSNAAEAVAQNVAMPSFSQATEFGIGLSAGTPAEALLLGSTYKHHTLRSSLSWQALRVMDRRQIDGILNSILEADNRNLNGTILHRLFSPAVHTNEIGAKCFGLWSNDGIASPPAFMGTTFPANESHYWATQAATLDSQDLEFAYGAIRSKGYGRDAGSQILVLANSAEVEKIATWRAGEESRPSSSILAKFDFIPSAKAPPFLTSESVVGKVAPDDYYGHEIVGTYGHGWILESPFIPAGYVAVVATGGPGSERNVVSLREHPNESYNGLLTLPGNFSGFPLIESHFLRSFGVGVRQRGGAVCLQVVNSTTYTPPAKELFGI